MGQFKSISLFSGAQGLDLGLEQAGIEIAVGQDSDQACVRTMQFNGRAFLAGDVRSIRPEDLLRASGMGRGEPFLICGGPPCQPFSTAGKRLGVNDPRGSLFMDFVRMIDGVRPRFFVMENVKGLSSMRLKDEGGQSDRTTVLDVILEQLGGLGYKLAYGLLDAVNYGAPQFRERLIILGSRDGEPVFLPVPTHFRIHQREERRWRTLGWAIRDLEDNPGECGTFSPGRAKYLKLIPEGGNWRDLPEDAKRDAMGGAYLSGGGKSGFYRRLAYGQPCPTLVASPVQKATMLCHPTRDRPLSVAEYARIQQFPYGWGIAGTTMDKYRQIGNAVPVKLARAVGEALIATADGSFEVKTKRVRGTGVHDRLQAAMGIGDPVGSFGKF